MVYVLKLVEEHCLLILAVVKVCKNKDAWHKDIADMP